MLDFPRPEHDDFWLLSEVILDSDVEATTESLLEAVRDYVDLQSLTYMAQQRAIRALGISSMDELTDSREETVTLAAAWMDAFVVGVRFERERSNPTSKSFDSDIDPRFD